MMWNTEQWRPLDLCRRGQLGPHDGELIVLHMIPRTAAPAELRKHYELRWICLREDGGGAP
ncbi:hypothetical protein [Pseudoflavonifractor phocaeensis]|uniref:hypothetical protein n=1 Tax=Pseudoflavonifractor phocaeensis TaxID=1870988 RepID=UPI00195AED94|nr:hypothetical protein [Pseudoflavonifractor phocaeensis]MBM6926938.1 hypothetical protein [Pseudoflavonifractor phocaeensis]